MLQDEILSILLSINYKSLVLTHLSSRYEGNSEILLEEAKKIFPNSILAEDLMRIELK